MISMKAVCVYSKTSQLRVITIIMRSVLFVKKNNKNTFDSVIFVLSNDRFNINHDEVNTCTQSNRQRYYINISDNTHLDSNHCCAYIL